MSAMAMWVDNPLFVKHVRSRLRKGQFLAPAVVTAAICGLEAYSAYTYNYFSTGWAFGVYVTIQAITLGMMGAAQVSSWEAGGAAESASWTSTGSRPLADGGDAWLSLGAGPRVRPGGDHPAVRPLRRRTRRARARPRVEVATLLGCWLLHALAPTALASKKPKAGTQGAIGILVFVMIVFSSAGGSGRWG